jgi:hypothetical protein
MFAKAKLNASIASVSAKVSNACKLVRGHVVDGVQITVVLSLGSFRIVDAENTVLHGVFL